MKRVCIIVLLLLVSVLTVYSAPVVVKIGSPAPAGSPWDKALKKIASGWKSATGGQVQMKIYPGGIAGDEPDMIRKMRFNSLQGAALTSIGLNLIAPDVMSLSIPFLIRDDDEFNYVLSKVEPVLLERMEKEGFRVVTWTMAGWVYFFSKKPATTPGQLKQMKLAAGEENPTNEQAWKSLGFDILQVPIHEVLPALNSGMIEACYIVPLGAAAYQWFGIANHMMDLPISPVLGSIVVSNKTWNRIPEKYHEELIEIADEAAEELYYETLDLEKDAIKIMLENGLIINNVSDRDKQIWWTEFQKGFDLVVGKTFSRDFYDRITSLVKQYRRANGG